jgi:integrase
MLGIKRLPRKEKTLYKHSDMWKETDHATFLKYCPNTRDRCYHAMVNDTSARPQEILNIKIKDIKFIDTDISPISVLNDTKFDILLNYQLG